jgi:NADPH:quinone reductase-like Zn-dependent oxidoreductase
MKAIGLSDFGGPEVLHVVELPEPHAGPGEVRIRVRAAGVNPVDVMLRDGSLAAMTRDLEPPFVPGMDIAGTIDEIGDDVWVTHGLAVGDEVAAIVVPTGSHGGYSEYVVVPADSVTRKPAGTTFPEAASFLMNSLAARNALDALALPEGSTLAVTGASGALGGYVVQLAAAEGMRTIATGSEDERKLLLSFGADAVATRGDGVAQRVLDLVPEGVDGVVDAAVLGTQIAPAVRDEGRIVVVRPWDGEPPRGITAHPVNVMTRAQDNPAINRLRSQLEAGTLTPRVAAILPADHAVEAHRRLAAGGLNGRIILEFPVR